MIPGTMDRDLKKDVVESCKSWQSKRRRKSKYSKIYVLVKWLYPDPQEKELKTLNGIREILLFKGFFPLYSPEVTVGQKMKKMHSFAVVITISGKAC